MVKTYGKDHYNFKGNKYNITDDTSYVIGEDAKGNQFIIDIEDYDCVSNYCWSGVSGRKAVNGCYFCARKSRKEDHKLMMLHNYIWIIHNGDIPKGKFIDHIDRNPANCRLLNLRLCDKSTNAINSGLKANNKTGITGVCWDNRVNKWRAYINFNGKRKELGLYKDKEDAIKARKEAEIIYHKEFMPIMEGNNG